MRKNTLGKLNLRRGASLMIALVIFLLCALAGASAVLMATANAGRYSHKSEQEYYTVSSAALMIVDMLDSLQYNSYTVNYDYKREWEYDEAGGEHTTFDGYTLTYPTENGEEGDNKSSFSNSGASTLRKSNLKLCPNIKKQCDALVPFLNIPEEWYLGAKREGKPKTIDPMTYSFTITVKNDERFAPVKCTLVMNDNYDLFMTFGIESGEYAITAYWDATVTVDQKTGNPNYVYADKDASGDYTKGSMTQNSTLKVTVKWSKKNVTISRGQATDGTAPAEGSS